MMNHIKEIIFVRHGKTDQHEALNPNTPINNEGKIQATEFSKCIEADWLKNANIFCSSHLRCRQTYDLMSEHLSYKEKSVTYDPLLREVDYGPGSDWNDIEHELTSPERTKMGKFYYRFKHGESPADAYVRACLFWDTAHRQASRNLNPNVLIISHGMMIRLLVMRWMHWSPDDYEKIVNPKNCHVIKLFRTNTLKWQVSGLEFLA